MSNTTLTSALIRTLPCGTRAQTGSGMPLVVSQRHWENPDLDVADLATVAADEVVLTGDGRHKAPGWHTGDDGEADWVFFERWTAAGRAAHGWIHPVSRQLLQSG